ncbi:17972_t:CDS:2 [Cetraspora pellucida]|uniref:17972_t:CDS:1 n=1 Tax=Cetraspora pellucida TaxID=1433469 RepID=A0ACA9L7E9_9GLOM|nr:17972_t:CDS:2 [Cetraspora pellucida]
MNLNNNINIDQSQIKTKTAKEEPTKDILKKLNNSLIENYTIDTNIVVDILATLYNDSNVAKTSFISNNNNKFKLAEDSIDTKSMTSEYISDNKEMALED